MSTAAGDGVGTTAARPPVPRSAEEITPEWLTGALQASGRDVVVRSITRAPLGEGVGMMSLLEHVTVDYERGDGPATMVLKLPATNEANRAVALAFDIYRRETLFYRDVAALTPAATPKVYVSEIDGKDVFVLLLEDLGHYRLGDQVVGCPLADAQLCMVELGELHATFWDDVERPELEFLPYHHPSHHSEGLRQGLAAGWDPMLATFGSVIPPELAAIKDRFIAAVPRMQEWIATPPLTVVHGDFRMDNLFFGTRPEDARAAAIDWQGAVKAKGVQDLGYLLGGSVEIDDRRAYERDLVVSWHETLCHRGVEGYSVDQAWEDYLRSLLYQWTVTTVIAGTLDPSNDRGRAWMTRMVERHATAIEDHQLRDLLPEFE